MEFSNRQVFDERRTRPGRDDEHAIGFALVGRQLGQEFVVGDARGCREPGLGADLRPDLLGNLRCRSDSRPVFGDVEIRLVERKGLDQPCILAKNRANLMRHSLVDLERGRTNINSGHFLLAVTDGMAERTPNWRAS